MDGYPCISAENSFLTWLFAWLAIEVSRTSRIVASMTAMAIHHGFTLGCQTAVSAVGEAVCGINGLRGEAKLPCVILAGTGEPGA